MLTPWSNQRAENPFGVSAPCTYRCRLAPVCRLSQFQGRLTLLARTGTNGQPHNANDQGETDARMLESLMGASAGKSTLCHTGTLGIVKRCPHPGNAKLPPIEPCHLEQRTPLRYTILPRIAPGLACFEVLPC